MSNVQAVSLLLSQRYDQWSQLQALPIYLLPPELIVAILNRLEIRDYPAVIFGMYHLLRRHGIAPSLPSGHVVLSERCPMRRNAISTAVGAALHMGSLPEELFQNIAGHLDSREKVAFVLALLATSGAFIP